MQDPLLGPTRCPSLIQRHQTQRAFFEVLGPQDIIIDALTRPSAPPAPPRRLSRPLAVWRAASSFAGVAGAARASVAIAARRIVFANILMVFMGGEFSSVNVQVISLAL